jgi:hypothetical protein
MTPTIELTAYAAPILHLSGFFTFDPDAVLRLSDTVKKLEAALRGDGTFAITTDSTRQDMSTLTAPPPVPPPQGRDTGITIDVGLACLDDRCPCLAAS